MQWVFWPIRVCDWPQRTLARVSYQSSPPTASRSKPFIRAALVEIQTCRFAEDTQSRLPPLASSVGFILVVDVDRDGDVDLFLAGYGPRCALLH